MDSRIIVYEHDHIKKILLKKNSPIYEATLIKELSKLYGYPRIVDSTLFNVHFSLFSALYTMKTVTQNYQYLIHIDPMRIRMIEFPEQGCREYFPRFGNFCSKKTRSFYCVKHRALLHTTNVPVFDPLTQFFLNQNNIAFQDYTDIDSLMSKVLFYSIHIADVKNAYTFFGIHNCTKNALHKRYNELSKKYHPDKGGSLDLMKELNRHYDVLKKIII